MGALFAPELPLLELFLRALKDKELDIEAGAVTIIPAPTSTNALADEILFSLQPVLQMAYSGAVQRPKTPAAFIWAHAPCQRWQLMTNDRAKRACDCGDKTARYKIEIPWTGANRFGRPKAKKASK